MATSAAPAHRIALLKADLLKVTVSAIVNPANTELWLGGGVAGAIAREGGPDIEAEAMAQGPIPLGAAVITRAGKLQQRGILYVIHAATLEPGAPSSATQVARATFAALECATRKRLPSLAFPALGTGVGGVSLPECAVAMLTTCLDYLERNELPRQVYIACVDDSALQAFRAIWTSLTPTEAAS